MAICDQQKNTQENGANTEKRYFSCWHIGIFPESNLVKRSLITSGVLIWPDSKTSKADLPQLYITFFSLTNE